MKSVTDAKIKITAAINIFIFIGRPFNIVIVLSPISNNKKKINTGIRIRKLRQELSAKRVSNDIIDMVLAQSDRDDNCEIIKIINKKRSRYPDENKMIAYLARQGFSYEDIKDGLDSLKD